jgi:hypothetical protein
VRVRINIGTRDLLLLQFSKSSVSPKTAGAANRRSKNAALVEQQPPQSGLDANCSTELIGLVWVDVDDSLAAAFQDKDPDAKKQVMKLANEQKADCMAAVDVAAAMVGLYIHPWLVSDRISESVVAFRRDSTYTIQVWRDYTVIKPVTLWVRDGARVQKRMRAPKDLGRALRVAPWLLRAWSASDDPVNEFVSLFVPFEVNLNKEQPPKKAQEEWAAKRDAILELVEKHGGEHRKELRAFLEQTQRPSPLLERFQQQAKRSGLKDWKEDVIAGRVFNAKRNKLLHSGDTTLRPDTRVKVSAGQVRTLEELVHRYVGKTIFGRAPRRRTKQHKGSK